MGEAEKVREEQIKRLEGIVSRLESLVERLKREGPAELEEAREEIEDLVDEAREALERVKSGRSEAEELKEVLNTVTPFFDRLGSIAKDLLGTAISQFTSSLDGRKLGEDIGSLYERLKQSGMPDDMVAEMVRSYAKKRIESVPSLPELLSTLIERLPQLQPPKIGREEKAREGEGKG